MKRYKYLEHTADYMVEVTGRSRELLFINTAYSIAGIMYNIHKVSETKSKIFQFSGSSFEEMFKSFIAGLILIVCRDNFLYRKINVNLKQKNYDGVAKIKGEAIDRNKHELFKEIKALTEHNFKLEKEGKIWKAVFVVDV